MEKKERKKHEFSGKSTKLGITYYGDKFVVATYIDSKLLNPRHIVYEKPKKLWPNDDDLKWDSEKIKLLRALMVV